MKIQPLLFIVLVSILQSLALFLPGISTMFSGPGFSAAIFLVSLITAHWAIFVPNMKPLHPLIALPVIFLTQWIVLTFSFSQPEFITDLLYGGNRDSFLELLDMEYGGIYRTMVIHSLVSLSVSAGLWMGRQHGKFLYRKAGRDLEEQDRVYTFRNRFHTEEPPTFFKYRSLLKSGQTILGIQKERILGMISGIRLDDTLFLYDLHTDPEWDDPDMDLQLIRHAILRPEILTSNIKDIALVLPAGTNGAGLRYAEMGFRVPAGDEQVRLEESLKKAYKELFDDWMPFAGEKTLLHAFIPENSPEEANARRLY